MKVAFVYFLALVLAQNQAANQTGAALPNVASAVNNAVQQVFKLVDLILKWSKIRVEASHSTITSPSDFVA